MQITDESGNLREMEPWEVEALEAAQRAHDDANGIVRQYGAAKADAILTGILANMADIPAYDAIRMVGKFPVWQAGQDYPAGWRVRWGDELFTVLQAHASQEGWEPNVSHSLFAKVLPGQSGSAETEAGEPGEWAQPDSTNPYAKGDRVAHGGRVWESLVDGNVWEPGAAGTESLWAEVA